MEVGVAKGGNGGCWVADCWGEGRGQNRACIRALINNACLTEEPAALKRRDRATNPVTLARMCRVKAWCGKQHGTEVCYAYTLSPKTAQAKPNNKVSIHDLNKHKRKHTQQESNDELLEVL